MLKYLEKENIVKKNVKDTEQDLEKAVDDKLSGEKADEKQVVSSVKNGEENFIEKELFNEDWYNAKISKVYPPVNEMYSFAKFELSQIKVIILGQDPYHGPNQANGLCFSVKKGIKLPPSLRNIYKELQQDLGWKKIPDHVEEGKANSHVKFGWETFTDNLIKYVNKNFENLVFLLWGGNAIKKSALVNKKKHCVLETSHPSPLSVHRGFFGCKHFSKANEYLISKNKQPIDWKL
ncbi:hypothetical protein HK099_007196 [Clydaea vesicula]|uniref:Uracil-DNA glycosylase-like domain-containing protein n=1 Tax=Clydaea vesicula TaxID=447962 RepID=A0AAD5XWI6_9FUNG|nr:hypothetical protein HK099_007196 [Clydaea vesicula]